MLASLIAPWLPALVSAVAVFLVSSVLHMALPWHRNDYRRLPDEDGVMDALRPFSIPPGEYMVPRPQGMSDLKSEAFLARMNRGPVFILNMFENGMRSMGGPLFQWFIYCFVVAWLAGHIAIVALHSAAPTAHDIVHTVGLTSFMGYCFALAQMSIWYRRPWTTTLKSIVDGFIYGLITGGIFLWLWPKV